MSFWTGISQLRTILATETDYDSPLSEELLEQIRENIEAVIMSLLDTGDSGSATEDPPDDTTGVLTDSGAAYDADEHNGRTLLMTSGDAIGNLYTIDDTTATTLVCTGDNLYDDGVRSADTYKILYDVKANAEGHDHDGTNSKQISASIDQAALKTSTQAQSEDLNPSNTHTFTLTGGTYCFTPQVRGESTSIQVIADFAVTTSYASLVCLKNTHGSMQYYAYVYHRYVTSSGEVYWIFIRRDKITKKIKGISACADHPCFGRGGKPALVWHPFTRFDPVTEEMICINPKKEMVREMEEATMVDDEEKPDRDILDVITKDYEIDEESEPEWPTERVTVKLDGDWETAWQMGKKCQIRRKVIPKPDNVLVRSLKKKTGIS